MKVLNYFKTLTNKHDNDTNISNKDNQLNNKLIHVNSSYIKLINEKFNLS